MCTTSVLCWFLALKHIFVSETHSNQQILEVTEYELLRACYEENVVRVQKLLPEIEDPASVKNYWFEDDETLISFTTPAAMAGWM